jgi:hypothetical protein
MRKSTLLEYANRGAWKKYVEANNDTEKKQAWSDYCELDQLLKEEWDKEDNKRLIKRIKFLSKELNNEEDYERRLFLDHELEKLTNEAWEKGIEI